MQYIDVFNGDADGLCALVQIRRDNPKVSKLVTGVKRDINLLRKVHVEPGDHITVLDISFEKNVDDVVRLLEQGAVMVYIDHHKTGVLLKHSKLTAHTNLSANTCTSLIVDKQLDGKYRAWAITAAFGDNLSEVAWQLGIDSGFAHQELDVLQRLGICLNYNSYGAEITDLFFDPADLYQKLCQFDSPFEFLEYHQSVLSALEEGYAEDMNRALAIDIYEATDAVGVVVLPNEPWARRVSGVFANDLAGQHPNRAHAILTEVGDNYLVSIRAPLNNQQGADIVASQFPTGGGRKAAAGINVLSQCSFNKFILVMEHVFLRNEPLRGR